MTVDVWTYWEGYKLPHIEACLISMETVCSVSGVRFHALDPSTVHRYVHRADLHESYRLTKPAIRADAIRVALLARHGGWWWDADTIGIRSPLALMEGLSAPDVIYLTWTRPPRRVLNGYLFLAPGARIAAEWLARVNEALQQRKTEWCELGERILTPLAISFPGACEVERRLFLPIDIDSTPGRFFEPGTPQDFVRTDTVAFGLNHSWMMYHHRAEMNLPSSRWRHSPLLIHQLLYHARRLAA